MLKSIRFKMVLALLIVMTILAACGGNQGKQNADQPVDAPPAPESSSETNPKKEVKVALLTVGTINDMGWNALAYEGLQAIEEKYGFKGTLSEKIVYTDIEEVTRTFADAGYDMIWGHAFVFFEPFLKVAPEYPDINFVCTGAPKGVAPNITGVDVNNRMQGFLAGCAAAMLSDSKKVGCVAGIPMPTMTEAFKGFEIGAKYINPDITVFSGMTGNNDDAAKMKELANSFIDQGADVMFASGNMVGRGSIDACVERGILAIGADADQNSYAPDTIAVSVQKGLKVVFLDVADRYARGELKPEFIGFGRAENAVFLSPWHGFEGKVSQDIKDKLAEIEQGLIDEKFDLMAMEELIDK